MKIRIITSIIISFLILSCNKTKGDKIIEEKIEINPEIKTNLERDFSKSAENFMKEVLKENLRIHFFDGTKNKKPEFVKIFQTEGIESIIAYSNKNYPKKSEPSYYEHFTLFVATYEDNESADKNFELLKSYSKYGISLNDLEDKIPKSAEPLLVGIKSGGLITKNGKFVFGLVETCRETPIGGKWIDYENKFIQSITIENQELEVLNSDCGDFKFYIEKRMPAGNNVYN